MNPFLKGGPYLMGVVNVTPDSFSDGGQFFEAEKAIAHGLRLAEEGAHILDIGGESTRPGSQPVTPAQEQDRVLPVIEGLRSAGCKALISVDTRNASTMQESLRVGAKMVNDVSALRHDDKAWDVLRKNDCLICLMHMQGVPQTMQDNPTYDNVVEDVLKFLSWRILDCETRGIEKSRLIADPGIGFGKGQGHNLELLAGLSRFQDLGVPVMLGVSRKSFIGRIAGGAGIDDRLPGSIAAALYGLTQGIQIFRVHDVAATRQALAVWVAAADIGHNINNMIGSAA